MNRQLITAVSAWVLASVALGAQVWESRPFAAWTDAELEQVLTSSPWSGEARFTAINKTASKYATKGLVTWSSSRVMREAQARQRMGVAGPSVAAHLQALVDEAPDRYVLTLTISGGEMPGVFSRPPRTALMVGYTFLNRRGKAPIRAERVEGTALDANGARVAEPSFIAAYLNEVERADFRDRAVLFGRGPVSRETSVIVCYFQKTDPIQATDQEVEFVTRLLGVDNVGSSYVKRKFKLKDMIVNGELQL